MGNITGSYKSLDRSTLTALKDAAASGKKIEASEVDAIETAAAKDGNVTAGEKALVQALRAATKDGKEIANFSVAGFDPKELSFDLNVTNNAGKASVESADQFIQNLPGLDAAARTDLLKAAKGAGLSANQQKELGQVLSRSGKPDEIKALIKAMGSSSPQAVKEFTTRLLKLTPAEQKASLGVAGLLMTKPAPADLRDQIKARLAAAPTPIPLQTNWPVGDTLQQLGLYLPNLKPDSPGVEDASNRMRSSYMSLNSTNPADPQFSYVKDMIGLAKRENFQVVLQVRTGTDKAKVKTDLMAATGITDPAVFDKHVKIQDTASRGYVWGEDNKWIDNDNKTVKVPAQGPDVTDALNAMDSFATAPLPGLDPKKPETGYATEGHHTAAQHGPVMPASRGNVNDNDAGVRHQDNAKQLGTALGMNVKQTRTYNEGGNMVTGTMPNGQPYAVIGRDGVLASTFLLEKREKDTPGSVPEFAAANIADRRKRLGLDASPLPADKKLELDQTLARLKKVQPTASESDAKNFLAKMDITKDVFAQDLGIPRTNLAFVPQPDFHIDMHLRPLGPGQVMYNDYKESIDFLTKARDKAPAGSWERKEIESMLTDAKAKQEAMDPVMKEIAKQLKAAGLTPIPAPGVMEGQMTKVKVPKSSPLGVTLGLSADKEFDKATLKATLTAAPHSMSAAAVDVALTKLFKRHVNFMNAIPGTSEGSNQQYYATNSTSNKYLRAQFEAFMKTQGIERVDWMGGTGGSESSKSASEQSLDGFGGLDCRDAHASLERPDDGTAYA